MASVGDGVRVGGAKGLPRSLEGLIARIDEEIAAAAGGGGGATEILHVRDEKASGGAGGTANAGAYAVRTLNTVVTNTIAGASLASNRFTLPAGTFNIRASAPAFDVNGFKAKLVNFTDASADVIIGTAERASSIGDVHSRSFIIGQFVLAAPKELQIEMRVVSLKATNGLGAAAFFGDIEVYTEVWVEKVA